MENVEAGSNYLKANCMSAAGLSTMEQVDGCLKSTVQIYSQYRRLVDLLSSLLSVPNRIVPIDAFFASTNSSRAAREVELKEYRAKVDVMEQSLRDHLDIYAKWTASILIDQANKAAAVDRKLLYKQQCLRSSRQLTLVAVQFLNSSRAPELFIGESRLTLSEITDAMEDFQTNTCPEIQTTDTGLNRLYDESQIHFNQAFKMVLSVEKGIR